LLLTAFRPCFGAPSYRNFRSIVAGWVQCLGRRTVTAVALASGALDRRHISVFHRFFTRAQWALDGLGRVLLQLAVTWLANDAPLLLVVDDTLARKSGKCISLASMHHDPLLSTARKPFSSFGHVWVIVAIWLPLPMSPQRGFALPILFRLYRGSKRGGARDAPSRRTAGSRQRGAQDAAALPARPTKLELAREMIAVVAGWTEQRTIYVVADSLYAGRMLLEQRPERVHVISRLRMDAALWTRPPARQPGQQGRPRRRGTRLPAPHALAAARRCWHHLPLTLYGRGVTVQAFRATALWYVALRDQPVRIAIVRDPSGRRRDEAFFCTDLTASVGFILQSYAHRWTLEVAFRDGKQHLGFENPQCQTAQAVRRTAPMAFIVYDLVLLWAANRARQGEGVRWVDRPWYRRKSAPSFLDMITAVRCEAWRQHVFDPPPPARRRKNSPTLRSDALLSTA
jgi:DDE superfamily endonuclease